MHLTHAASFVVLATQTAARTYCPPLGPVLPAPISPSTSNGVKSAVKILTDNLANLAAGLNMSAVSVSVKSIHETQPMFDFHHTPPKLSPNGTQKVDATTVYRVGSISKVFTVLGVLLLEGVQFDDPVTKYLPELRGLRPEGEEVNAITTPDWDSITIGSLASHMSGIAADLIQDMTSIPGGSWASLGLPDLSNTSGPACGGVFGLPPCAREEFFRDFGKRHPVYAPYTNVVYSNVGIGILGFVLEAVSGKPFDEYMRASILEPLGLKSTTTGLPPKDSSLGFIPDLPVEVHWWGVDLGWPNWAGGFYSNTVDLLAFGASILESRLLKPVKTRQWMKPVSSTASSGMQFGAPWEIFRAHNVTRDGRLIEIYTKSGDLGSYSNDLVLVPDYDLVITVLTGGPESSNGAAAAIYSAVVKALLPAIEAAGKDEAKTSYAGTYTDPATNSSITLCLDDGPGFTVTDWTVRGTNVFKNFVRFLPTGAPASADVPVTARLYPSNLSTGSQRSWRAHFEVGTPEERAALNDGRYFWADAGCYSFAQLDRTVYHFASMEDVVFSVENGVARSLELRGFRVELARAK
ncbi:uncharacterized protein PG998_012824 [Apiospora kogelbergensis]|uniref:uncharacterized protein n=1 Tax=Apiospora kogelbergensis TaxID=1337665 RepID=UPI00312DD73E